MNSDLEIRLRPMVEATKQDWDFLTALEDRFFEASCPEGYRVNVWYEEIENGEDDTAYVELDGKLFDLVLDERLSLGTIWDYMIHEYAHIGTWLMDEEDDHGPLFGVEYARLYCIYLELYEEHYG